MRHIIYYKCNHNDRNIDHPGYDYCAYVTDYSKNVFSKLASFNDVKVLSLLCRDYRYSYYSMKWTASICTRRHLYRHNYLKPPKFNDYTEKNKKISTFRHMLTLNTFKNFDY